MVAEMMPSSPGARELTWKIEDSGLDSPGLEQESNLKSSVS